MILAFIILFIFSLFKLLERINTTNFKSFIYSILHLIISYLFLVLFSRLFINYFFDIDFTLVMLSWLYLPILTLIIFSIWILKKPYCKVH